VFGAPTSTGLFGPGNLAPPATSAAAKKVVTKVVKCKRGYVKKKVKKKEVCVKVKRKKAKKAKRAINDRRTNR
jgi:hypothetical protein